MAENTGIPVRVAGSGDGRAEGYEASRSGPASAGTSPSEWPPTTWFEFSIFWSSQHAAGIELVALQNGARNGRIRSAIMPPNPLLPAF